jgi:hypothetical protein
MIDLIFFLIFLFSFFGMFFIFFRKIPLLLSFEFPKESAIERLKNKLRELNPLKNFSLYIFLQKLITRIRILSLKIDNLTFNLLRILREKQKKKEKKDDYWEKIKKYLRKDKPA